MGGENVGPGRKRAARRQLRPVSPSYPCDFVRTLPSTLPVRRLWEAESSVDQHPITPHMASYGGLTNEFEEFSFSTRGREKERKEGSRSMTSRAHSLECGPHTTEPRPILMNWLYCPSPTRPRLGLSRHGTFWSWVWIRVYKIFKIVTVIQSILFYFFFWHFPMFLLLYLLDIKRLSSIVTRNNKNIL